MASSVYKVSVLSYRFIYVHYSYLSYFANSSSWEWFIPVMSGILTRLDLVLFLCVFCNGMEHTCTLEYWVCWHLFVITLLPPPFRLEVCRHVSLPTECTGCAAVLRKVYSVTRLFRSVFWQHGSYSYGILF